MQQVISSHSSTSLRAVRSSAAARRQHCRHSSAARRRASCCCTAPLRAGMPTIDPPPNKDDGGGTGVLDRPGLDLTKGGINMPKLDDQYGAGETSGKGVTGGGNYRVMLLDSPKHTEKLVVSTLTTVVGTEPNHAKNCFATSKQLGQALVTTCLKEHAEFYAEQIKRKGVAASIEPDSTVL